MTTDSIPLSGRERQQRYIARPANQTKKRARGKSLKQSRRERGLCVSCGASDALDGLQYCAGCKAYAVDYHKRRRSSLAEQGTCAECGKEPVLEGPALHGGAHSLGVICFLKRMAKDHLGTATLWELLRDKLTAQDDRCAYSGERLTLGMNASIDHKMPVSRFPDLRHDPDNVEWVSLKVNDMKKARTPDEFMSILHTIINYRPRCQVPT